MGTIVNMIMFGLLGGALAYCIVRVFGFFLGFVILAVIFLSTMPDVSEAASYRSSSSRSYSAPRTVTRNVTVNKTVIQRNTVVQQHRGSSGPSATSSFFSGAAGAMGGSLLGQWLFAPKAPTEVPQEAPVAPVQTPCDATLYDCTPKAQVAQ